MVEVMGHRTRAGAISDCQIGGATMLRIEHPTLEALDGSGEPTGEPLTEIYSAAAIFAIRICSVEEAKAIADYCWARPVIRPQMPELAQPYVDADDDWQDD